MSAIASFIRIPITAIEGLHRAATPPKKKLFGTERDTYWDYLRKNGQEVADYKWSGWVFNPLLVYLDEREQINFSHSSQEELAAFLTKARGDSHFILTAEHRRAYLARLEAEFSEEALCDFYNDFNECDEAEAGKPMLDGVLCLRDCLRTLDDQSIAVFIIG
jgi:hypothetical protein